MSTSCEIMKHSTQSPGIVEVAKKKRHIYLLEKLHSKKPLSRPELKELEKFEGKPVPAGIVDTQEQIAKAFGVAVRTAQRWIRDGMPTTPEGKFSIAEIQAWRIARKKSGRKSQSDDKSHWEARLKEAQARAAELDLKKRLGELISREEVEQGWAERAFAVKTAFLGLPRRVALQLVGLEAREIESILSDHVKGIIRAHFLRETETRKSRRAKTKTKRR